MAVLADYSAEIDNFKTGSEVCAELQDKSCFDLPWLGFHDFQFSLFPVLTKRDLRANLEYYLNARVQSSECWVKYTSGTSGAPCKILYDSVFHFDQLSLFRNRLFKLLGLSTDSLTCGPIHTVAMHDNIHATELFLLDPFIDNKAYISFCLKEYTKREACRVSEFLTMTKPKVITLKPTLLHFFVDQNMGDVFKSISLDYVVCSGGYLDPSIKTEFEQTSGVRTVNAYGLTETGLIAYSCEDNKLHVDPDIFVEILDDNYCPVTEGGVGNVLITSLRNKALPLVRYFTGDLGSIERITCTCGRYANLLSLSKGRVYCDFILSNGSKFPTTPLTEIYGLFDISEFQLVQLSTDQFKFLYNRIDGSMLNERKFSKYLEDKLSQSIKIDFESCDNVIKDPDKFQRFKCNV